MYLAYCLIHNSSEPSKFCDIFIIFCPDSTFSTNTLGTLYSHLLAQSEKAEIVLLLDRLHLPVRLCVCVDTNFHASHFLEPRQSVHLFTFTKGVHNGKVCHLEGCIY